MLPWSFCAPTLDLQSNIFGPNIFRKNQILSLLQSSIWIRFQNLEPDIKLIGFQQVVGTKASEREIWLFCGGTRTGGLVRVQIRHYPLENCLKCLSLEMARALNLCPHSKYQSEQRKIGDAGKKFRVSVVEPSSFSSLRLTQVRWLEGETRGLNKLESLGATLVQNYDRPT